MAARQMDGSFAMGWYDACAVMMRRLVEASIIETCEARGVQANVRNANGDYFQLTELSRSGLLPLALRHDCPQGTTGTERD